MINVCQCGKQKPIGKEKNKFCSRSCAATFTNKNRDKTVHEKQRRSIRLFYGNTSEEAKQTKKNPLISAKKLNTPYTEVKQCTFCKKWFNFSARKSTTCSDQCFIDVKMKMNKKGKRCVHENGQEFESSWELKIAVYLDEQGIKWIRPKESLPWFDSKGTERKYFPDFYLPELNIYLDPKNPLIIKHQTEKLKYLSENYNNLYWGSIEHLKQIVSQCTIR
jgi:hypothetical protein